MAEVAIGKTIPFTVTYKDKDGNPTKPTGVATVTQSTPATDTLTVDSTGLFGSCVGLAVGTDVLTATDAGSGVTGDSEELDVVAGPPATVTVNFGTPLP